MIEESAMVISTDGDYVEVETVRKSACGSCSAKAGCGTSVLSKVYGNKASRMRIYNSIHARPGDQVVIGIQERVLVRTSFIFYLTPLFSMILFALLGQSFTEVDDPSSRELASIFGGLFGLLVGFGFLKMFAKRMRSDSNYEAVILRHDVASSQEVFFR